MSKPFIFVLEELIDAQRELLLKNARKLIPHVTSDDILQPNDFPALEFNPEFRYEEGILAGLLSAQAALRSINRVEEDYGQSPNS